MRYLLAFALIMILVPAPLAAQSSATGCAQDYSGYLPPRLSSSDYGIISADGVPNRVRALPSRSADYLFDLQPGIRFPLIAGPVCNEGIVWWLIEIDGRGGWTAESNAEDRTYYLQSGEPDATVRPLIAPDTLTDLALLPYELPSGSMSSAANANVLAIADAADQLTVYDANNPAATRAALVLERHITHLSLSPGGSYVALGLADPEDNEQRIAVYRYIRGGIEPLFQESPLLDIRAELPLRAVALHPLYLASAHGDEAAGNGLAILWSTRTWTEIARFELPFPVDQLAFDASGLGLVVSTTRRGDATHLINLVTLEDTSALNESGVLAVNRAANPALGQLLIGKHDGSVTFVNVLAGEQTGSLGPGRLERLGAVEIFAATGDQLVAVTALAIHPDGTLVSIVGIEQAEIAHIDLASAVAFPSRLPVPEAGRFDTLAFTSDGTGLLASYRTRDEQHSNALFGIQP
ncbi:MAG: hypothetical protein SF123_23615 [Chloroflexota bacterium]|nr:hypothetical protein [Chloroflexota bacterium]